MTQSPNQLVPVPATVFARRLIEEQSKALRRRAQTSLDAYIRELIKEDDWLIQEQPVLTLPLGLTEYISLALRDEGNALIAETRAINNRYVGRSMGGVKTTLISDIEVLDLGRRVLDWVERAMNEVLYRNRRRIKDQPDLTYWKFFESFIKPIDTGIAHRADRLYQLAWTRAIDCMCYLLVEGCFFTPGHLTYRHDDDADRRFYLQGEILTKQRVQALVFEQMNLFGMEPALYLKDVVLKPLALILAESEPPRTPEELRREFHSNLGNLLEAFPYLCSSTRNGRYLFSVPGTGCAAAFRFIASDGFAAFWFADSEESLRAGLESNRCRAVVEIGFDGTVSCSMHPWLTLERILGEQDALRVKCWLFRQVHAKVVNDFLKINHYFMEPADSPAAVDAQPVEQAIIEDTQAASEVGPSAGMAGEFATYVEWVREVQEVPAPEASDRAEFLKDEKGLVLPQIRRSRFFRVLQACGVAIEQGKGSEIKLLRGGAHPFRLGNHYGPNPTVPTFLAAQILKRLEITAEDWAAALKASKA